MRKAVIVVLAVLLIAGALSSANAWTLNFENGLGHNNELVGSEIPGVTFSPRTVTDKLVYADATTGLWNVRDQFGNILGGVGNDWMYDKVALAGDGRITVAFTNQDASFFSTGYSSFGGLGLVAYDAAGNLIDWDEGYPNTWNNPYGFNPTGPMGTLSVSSTSHNIAYVIIGGGGTDWFVDNMSGDATGVPDQTPPGNPVPEPATLLLFGLGLVGGAIKKRMAK